MVEDDDDDNYDDSSDGDDTTAAAADDDDDDNDDDVEDGSGGADDDDDNGGGGGGDNGRDDDYGDGTFFDMNISNNRTACGGRIALSPSTLQESLSSFTNPGSSTVCDSQASHTPRPSRLCRVVEVQEKSQVFGYNFYGLILQIRQCFISALLDKGNLDSSALAKLKLTQRAHYMLAETMKINPIRVSDVQISKDFQNVFVNLWLLGTVNIDQFEKLPAQAEERVGDALYTGIQPFDACADVCVNYKDFQCNGFIYCPGDSYSCRLSKTRVVTGEKVAGATTLCDAFSRTSSGPAISDSSLADAYTALQTAVHHGDVQIILQDSQGFEPPPFTAISTEITSGALVKDKPMPSLPSQFFNRVETVIPEMQVVVETYIWYDRDLQLVRYDSRDPQSQLEMTYIHDFNTGVAYQINQVTQECTISTIGSNGAFNIVTSTTNNGSAPTTLSLKTPMDLFYIDSAYKYLGQSTERGILCDVFEARRTDFRDKLAESNITDQISVFKYYFQAEDWAYTTAEGMDTTRGQIVRLDIEDRTLNTYRSFNIYDFNDEHHAFSFYDTSVCFEPDQRKSFVIVFKDQPYHPSLDAASNSFINSALVQMSQQTLTSPARFQKVSVTYDDSSVYLLVTALGLPPPLALFYKSGQVPRDLSAPQEIALFPDDCAAACVQSTSFVCNSFDFCDPDSDTPSCLLRADRVAIPGASKSAGTKNSCTRYFLFTLFLKSPPPASPILLSHPHILMNLMQGSENVTRPLVSADKIFQVLTDAVYDSQFQISIQPPKQQVRCRQQISLDWTATASVLFL
ncbi:EF-hand domain-containing protein d1 [Plakobranchus ocellatus]|uniref:EF-hand domain-containing protein d1 n=1 Tax=Plakobranchus ocellatus TaxID=259542 RepID=A0AAV4ACD0_9GAST|nr:EF-hand domain-containing protein d1 [Plakobranchus ocellatus]